MLSGEFVAKRVREVARRHGRAIRTSAFAALQGLISGAFVANTAASDVSSGKILYDLESPSDLQVTNGRMMVKGGVAETAMEHYRYVFELLTKRKWADADQAVHIRIMGQDLAGARLDEHCGVFLLARYKNKRNYYSAGLLDDGRAVIEKTRNGRSSVLATQQAFGDVLKYDPYSNPNLLPKDHWVGLGVEIRNRADGSVWITLYVDHNGTGDWEKVATAIDRGERGAILNAAGASGIRARRIVMQFKEFKSQSVE